MSSFYITEDVQADGLAVLAVSGEIDFEVSPRLRASIDRHVKAGHGRLMLDLSEASFIDSTAIGVIAGCATSLRRSGEGLMVIVCPVENRKIMRILASSLHNRTWSEMLNEGSIRQAATASS